MIGRVTCLAVLWATPYPARAADAVAPLLADIQAVSREGAGSPAARAAWDRLVAQGPRALPELLRAMDARSTVAANWLRTAFDRIAETALAAGGRGIDADAMLAFARDAANAGRARRLALELVERLRPGTTARLLPGWLEDSEFRFDAVARQTGLADKLAAAGKRDEAVTAYRTAFAAARDLQQTRDLAAALKKLGVSVSVAQHLGFLTDWAVIGPFDAHGMKGFRTAYPPETRMSLAAEPPGKLDLAGEFPGKAGLMRWKRYRVSEATVFAPGRYALATLNAPEALGDAEDAVGYAYTEFAIPRACDAEFRGAADDNFTVWVNGKRAFGFEEYRNGVRLDRHRFKVRLRAGANTVLVKVCQAPRDENNTEPNWEFMLRVVDGTGKGIAMRDALPPGP